MASLKEKRVLLIIFQFNLVTEDLSILHLHEVLFKKFFSNLTPKNSFARAYLQQCNSISSRHYLSILPICRIMLPIKIVAQEVQFVAWVEKRRYSSSPCSILLSHSIHSSRHIKETNRYQFSNPSFLTVIGSAFPIDRPKNPFDSRKQIIWWKKMFLLVRANFCLITKLLTFWYILSSSNEKWTQMSFAHFAMGHHNF